MSSIIELTVHDLTPTQWKSLDALTEPRLECPETWDDI